MVEAVLDDLLPALKMHELVDQAVTRAGERSWTLAELPWATLRPERLTEADRSAVRFITYVEDHIPGYLSHFLEAFPVADAEQELARFGFNREYFRFLVAWASDEERHASALARYQVETGMATREEILASLAEEGRKKFVLPYEHPVQSFTYTLVQEKATQLFYQRFRETVSEPFLKDLLGRLARDEARHFAFYSNLVGAYVVRDGAAAVPGLKDVIATFRMPLADTMKGYWRWSLKVADSTAYDHTEAYDSVVRLVRGFVDTPGEPSVEDLGDFVQAIRRVR
ncbi:acyl-ACP desaturase [Streptomyces pseudovenezuelae]|uniref:Acyl-[acyl-carrier-protein] desaturase n=1 Tax=Streptomyces pseudovenezuelae TaxID=67350 RepID=A0ABT6M466_9ACTN|nr:acyl-ACP desaturase [Streptomyces pseudovenezuelae]MDH6222925.1 acyl-[acyl-carrier-protein] desaturase [Streptomyces pseudovenezuelae]